MKNYFLVPPVKNIRLLNVFYQRLTQLSVITRRYQVGVSRHLPDNAQVEIMAVMYNKSYCNVHSFLNGKLLSCTSIC